MSKLTITLDLPDELIQDARDLGLLTDDVLSDLLRTEVDRRVMELVNNEIQAYRAEKRSGHNVSR